LHTAAQLFYKLMTMRTFIHKAANKGVDFSEYQPDYRRLEVQVPFHGGAAS